jgi:NADP-dependent 3-hydroxy acid dehydrogenase YdfG
MLGQPDDQETPDWLPSTPGERTSEGLATGGRADLTGRRVLVSGASSGIGATTARVLIGCGASVAMLARRKERLDELSAELGERAIGVAVDVTDLARLAAAVDEAAAALGGLDGLVAVAGKMMTGSIATGTPERWRQLFDLNLLGPLATVRYALPHYPDAGTRDVVIVGSSGAISAQPGVAIYGASKRGLQAACDTLRLELAPSGVRVGVVTPGMFQTEGLTLEGIEFDGETPHNDFPLFVPGAGPQPPEPLADAIAFMLSLPEGVAVHELVLRPTGQLYP